MIVRELTGTENHDEYKNLELANLDRQLHFLQSLVSTAVNLDRKFLSQTIIKALNFHAIACLHVNAGEYRPCQVYVGEGENQYIPPEYNRVEALMDDFVNLVNVSWNNIDQILLAAYVLWRLNWIHPFINGNGRTARACCYFVLCVKSNGLLPGREILPRLLKENNAPYIEALKYADSQYTQHQPYDQILIPLKELIRTQLNIQLASVDPSSPANGDEQ